MFRLSTLLLLPLFVTGQEDFQCGVPELASFMSISKSFDTINPEPNCNANDDFFVPETIHWHLHAIADGDIPRISMQPEGLVEPYVSGGSLQFNVQKSALKDVSKGEKLQVGVNLYIPVSQMKNIRVSGADQVVEVINNEPSFELESMNLNDSGVHNKLYVRTPFTSVHYKGSGVDNLLEVKAASGSSIQISGVNQKVRIKTGEGLTVKMTGVRQTVLIEGSQDQIKMTGVHGDVYVNGESGCDNVANSGANNNCSPTEKAVTVEDITCLVLTKAVRQHCGFSTAATVGAVVGAVVVVLLIALCCFCAVKGCCGSQRWSPAVAENEGIKTVDLPVASTDVIEAEVIQVQVADQVIPGEKNIDIEEAHPKTMSAKTF